MRFFSLRIFSVFVMSDTVQLYWFNYFVLLKVNASNRERPNRYNICAHSKNAGVVASDLWSPSFHIVLIFGVVSPSVSYATISVSRRTGIYGPHIFGHMRTVKAQISLRIRAV